MALARASKAPTVKAAITNLVQTGRTAARPYQPPSAQFQQPQRALVKSSSMLQQLDRVSFDELLLEPHVQAILDEIVVELEYREELAQRKLRARNRLLFWGPPGNGKSSSAAAMGSALDVPAYGVSLPRTISKYLGETGQNLGQLFDGLTEDTLIVFDEIDAVGSNRGTVEQAAGKEMNGVVNTMLTLLDRCRKGVIVATTNRPDILDPALLRRFDELVEFPAPNALQMQSLAEKLCEGYGVPPVDVSNCQNFDEVAKRCETEARRIVMRELLAAEAAEEDNETGDENGSTEEEDGQEG
jgi:SpoVK/Ycf46/Vps4 family AAA+-type ATPase